MQVMHLTGNVVTSITISSDIEDCTSGECDQHISVADANGHLGVGSTLDTDGFFYAKQPHPQWIKNGDGTWRPPLGGDHEWSHKILSGDLGVTADKIIQLENFVESETVSSVMLAVENENIWVDYSGDIKKFATELTITAVSADLLEKLQFVINEVALQVESIFSVKVNRPKPNISKMPSGFKEQLHHDKMFDSYQFESISIPDKDITAVIYWNDDFNGGKLSFKQHKVSVTPKPGLVVMFPSDKNFQHEVTEVQNGDRYATVLFFSVTSRNQEGYA